MMLFHLNIYVLFYSRWFESVRRKLVSFHYIGKFACGLVEAVIHVERRRSELELEQVY